MTSSPIDISNFIVSSSINMQSFNGQVHRGEEKVALEHQENLTQCENRRDDIQLQRLGKKPVLKASQVV